MCVCVMTWPVSHTITHVVSCFVTRCEKAVFRLVESRALSPFNLDDTGVQSVTVDPPLTVLEGQYVALVGDGGLHTDFAK